ncbi:Uncharacterised protein [Photobacterium damselae]|nr:Uncharacterised protein [Photobacterium damselae]
MDKKALEAFAREAAKSIKTESNLDDFRKTLTKVTVETALNAEVDQYLLSFWPSEYATSGCIG